MATACPKFVPPRVCVALVAATARRGECATSTPRSLAASRRASRQMRESVRIPARSDLREAFIFLRLRWAVRWLLEATWFVSRLSESSAKCAQVLDEEH